MYISELSNADIVRGMGTLIQRWVGTSNYEFEDVRSWELFFIC